MILWPVMDQGQYQVLPLSLTSYRAYFSRTASPRAARTVRRRRKRQSRPLERTKACEPARQTLASDGSRTAKGGTVEPAQLSTLVFAHGLPARRAIARHSPVSTRKAFFE